MNLKLIKNSTNNSLYYTIEPLVATSTSENKTLNAEYWYLPSEQDSAGGVYNASKAERDLQSLSAHLNNAYKNISYYDIYNISDVVTEAEHLDAKINQMSVNSSIVINADRITTPSDEYHRGDIIMKTSNGSINHIPAASSGYYYPARIVQVNNGNHTYQLSYKYSNGAPPTKTETPKVLTPQKTETLQSPTEEIAIQFTANATPSSTYGNRIILQPRENKVAPLVSALSLGGNHIQPVVKLFIKKENDFKEEEFSCSFSLQLDSTQTKWEITNIPNIQGYQIIAIVK